MNQQTGHGHYALVAGGSKGIGFAIAEALAKRKFSLILVARHVEDLETAKNRLQDAYHVNVAVLVYDLSQEQSAGTISAWCINNNIRLKVLCNVVGLGGTNDYLTGLTMDEARYMLNLNIGSAVALSHHLLPLLERNPSYILNVASMAGFAPIPDKNMYSATKSAVISFSYSLRYQLKDKNISVSCLSPGPVFTKPSVIRDTKQHLGWFGMKMAVPPHEVGEIAVSKMLKKKMMIIPGALASFSAFIIRMMPRRVMAYLYYKQGKRTQ